MTSESLADDARPSGNPRRPAPTSAGRDPSLPGSAATTTMAPSRARHRTGEATVPGHRRASATSVSNSNAMFAARNAVIALGS